MSDVDEARAWAGGVAPVVSVIIVNYRGADDTIACIAGLRDLHWPQDRLEIVVVENASGDESAARIRAAAPEVTLIESKRNTGFAGGCNLGAARASGAYLAFLNNDARPDPQWLTRAVDVLEHRAGVACVASRVLDWEGEEIDFAAASMSFYGHGFKMHAGDTQLDAHGDECDVLFASGAAMVIDAAVFTSVGGFDERYFMFFEDVDLGWRLWLLGYEVRYVPTSVVYHRHHASMSEIGSWREHFLLERNALYTIYKNYSEETLRTVLPAALALTVGRSVIRGGDDPQMLEVSRGHERRVGDGERPQGDPRRPTRGRRVPHRARRPDEDPERAPVGASAERRGDHAPLPATLPPQLEPARIRGAVRGGGGGIRGGAAVSRTAAHPGGDRRHAPAGHGGPRHPGLADRTGALPRARRRAREHHEGRGALAPRLPGPSRSTVTRCASWSTGATS